MLVPVQKNLWLVIDASTGRKLDSVEEMGLWLDVDKLDDEGDASDPPDMFVIGFQEVRYAENTNRGPHQLPSARVAVHAPPLCPCTSLDLPSVIIGPNRRGST